MTKLYIPHQGKLLELEVDPTTGIDNMRSLGYMIILSLAASVLNIMEDAKRQNLKPPKQVLGHPVEETRNLLYHTMLALRQGNADRVRLDLEEDSKLRRDALYKSRMLFELGYTSLTEIITVPLKLD